MATKTKNTEKTTPTAVVAATAVAAASPVVGIADAGKALQAAIDSAVAQIESRKGNMETIRAAADKRIEELVTAHNTAVDEITKACDTAIAAEVTAIDQIHASLRTNNIKVPGLRIGRVGRPVGSKNKYANGGAKARVPGERSGGKQRNTEGQSTTEAVLNMINKSKEKVADYDSVMTMLKESFDHGNPNSVIAYLKRTCKLVQTEPRGGGFRFPTVGELKRWRGATSETEQAKLLPASGPYRANSEPAALTDLL